MSTTVYFVRHSGPENPDRIVPGRIPGYRLSTLGRETAEKTGEFFKNKPIKYIYTSPLERAYETANIIGKYLPKAKINHVYELTEVDSIHWQAYKLEELFTNNYYEAFLNDPATKDVPENLDGLAKRLDGFTQRICEEHKGQEIICVSHLYPIVALRLYLEGKPLTMAKNYEVSTASVTTFEFDKDCKLTRTDYTVPS
ncbi:MAG: hypothetical protein A2Z11_04005 [Candidatus Woykebacteria bacterium RBG_16_43_9]|uniref:Phosphoglycerate mutase n=1 Tax=Candidatus Woykebacteria bacterium RBG_16_43_9 TaxID=1802596 RepID=A0A1G1WBY9_9BACT|nr:MAG: hypothetical protein A2Z11_04005 [Candidatus Woykebacteria bacterium RBG_16_43_9]